MAADLAELERALAERDDAAFAVYGDLLAAAGDPRGQLIAAQQQKLPVEAKLLAKHRAAWIPPLLGKVLASVRRMTAPSVRTEVTWRNGFFDVVKLARPSFARPSVREVLPELLVHPSAKYMRVLILGCTHGEDGTDDYARELAAIAETGHALLDELVVGTPGSALQRSRRNIGDVGPAVRALPRLKRLVIDAASARTQGAERDGLAIVMPGSARPMITIGEIEARIENNLGIDTANEIARPRRWVKLARDGAMLWGRYVGSEGDEYRVHASLAEPDHGCTCASTFDPCKHAVALLLLAANGHAFKEAPFSRGS